MSKNRDEKGKFIKGHKSGFKKGYVPWNKGKKCPAISKALKGIKFSKESVLKRNQTRKNKGVWHTEETKKKISLGNMGKKMTKEACDRMSKSQTGKHIGKEHWNWRGGITLLRNRLRNSKKYAIWRSKVFKRDNFICQRCKIRGGSLEPHHIKSFSKLIKENNIKTFEQGINCRKLWEVKNGITYCIKCHSFVDSFRNRITKVIN